MAEVQHPACRLMTIRDDKEAKCIGNHITGRRMEQCMQHNTLHWCSLVSFQKPLRPDIGAVSPLSNRGRVVFLIVADPAHYREGSPGLRVGCDEYWHRDLSV